MTTGRDQRPASLAEPPFGPLDFGPLPRGLVMVEIAIVLLLSLGRSAVYSVVNLVAALTEPGGLSSQTTTMNRSLAPGRPWLDLTYQLLSITFALVPVALAGYLLVRTGVTLRAAWWGHRSQVPGDVGRGAVLAALVGAVGLAFYLATYALGTNLTVVASGLDDVWWRYPVLVLSALENALVEECIVLGFVLVRLRQAGFGNAASIITCAVLRGSYHLYQGLGGFVGNLVMGLFFGWLYTRWGRITPLVVTHTLLDIGAFVGYAVLAGNVSWIPGG